MVHYDASGASWYIMVNYGDYGEYDTYDVYGDYDASDAHDVECSSDGGDEEGGGWHGCVGGGCEPAAQVPGSGGVHRGEQGAPGEGGGSTLLHITPHYSTV